MFNDIQDLTFEQFKRFAAIVYKEANINLNDSKVTLLSNRLRKRLRALELNSYEDYYRYLTGKDGPAELGFFLEVVTTNETYFWRTTQNFDMLKDEILPELLEANKGQTLKFWSAGCSSGEEPYNLAIELVEAMKVHGIYDFKIRATDISQRMVDFANVGRYHGRKIEKIPERIMSRYFKEVREKEGHFLVRPDIKNRVEFQQENLFESKAPPQHCIFCRNVMIYFNRKDQERLVCHFHDQLEPGGFLIIGHSESLQMMDTPFTARSFKLGIAYQRKPN